MDLGNLFDNFLFKKNCAINIVHEIAFNKLLCVPCSTGNYSRSLELNLLITQS